MEDVKRDYSEPLFAGQIFYAEKVTHGSKVGNLNSSVLTGEWGLKIHSLQIYR